VGHRFLVRHAAESRSTGLQPGRLDRHNAHDIDDGVRSGLLEQEQLLVLPLFARFHAEVLREFAGLTGKRLLYETIRRMPPRRRLYDVIDTSGALMPPGTRPANADAARGLPALIGFSPALQTRSRRSRPFCASTCTGTRASWPRPKARSRW